MSKALSLQVSQRAGIGRAAVKAVRKAGRIPGVLYGKAKGDKAVHSRAIEIEAKKLGQLLQEGGPAPGAAARRAASPAGGLHCPR
jgi:ribosomal protein L25 (general stress protein Ctc)